MPNKLHHEIALGNFYPKEDVNCRELVDFKEREQLVADHGSASEITRPFGGAGETDRLSSGPTSTGVLGDTNSLMEAENANLMEDRSGQLDPSEHAEDRMPQRKMRMIRDAEVPFQDATETSSSKSLASNNHEHAPANIGQRGMAINTETTEIGFG